MSAHLVFGLTGQIGTGKSIVGSILRELGARVIDSDVSIRVLLESDAAVRRQVQDAFPAARAPDGDIDRGALARVVFGDQEQLERLQRLLYPALGKVEEELLTEATDAPVTFIEAVNVVEGPSAARLDGLWVVEAAETLMIERVVASGRLTRSEIQARLSMQAGPDDKAELFRRLQPEGPIVRITNDGTLQQLREQVITAWQQLVGG